MPIEKTYDNLKYYYYFMLVFLKKINNLKFIIKKYFH